MQIFVQKIDNSRVELRTVHEIAPASRRRGFELSAYFFVPVRLASGSSDELDGAQALAQPVVFPGIQRKNHYQVFAMRLPAILDRQNQLSPLARLEHMAQQVALPAGQVLYELQMLICVAKSASSKARRSWFSELARVRNLPTAKGGQPPGQEAQGEVEALFFQTGKDYLQLQQRLEQLGERYLHETAQNIAEAYRWTLEDLNHQILDWFLQAARLAQKYPFSTDFQQFVQRELDMQWLYQKQHDFWVLGEDDYQNESYLFHQRELKAWRNGGLSMASSRARSQNVLAHLWLAVASAVAMSFALAVTLLTMGYYGQWSLPFLAFAVLGYIFKDRIKEILRHRFASKFSSYKLLRLYDPRSKVQCGSIRENLVVLEEPGIPADITTLRCLHKNPLSIDCKRDIVIAYHEKLRLNSKKLFRTHRRLQSGCQILEFNLRPYLDNIRESEAKQLWRKVEDKSTGAPGEDASQYRRLLWQDYQKIKIKRSYHLTLVVKVRSFDGQEICQRHRVVLRGKKIDWIKHIA